MVDLQKVPKLIRSLIRALQGLQEEDDVTQGFIHTADNRERAKLTPRNVFRHAYMDLLALKGGSEWMIMSEWAEDERHLTISENQERAMAFISAMKKQAEPVPQTNITTNLQQAPIEEKKKGLFHR